MEHGGEPRHLGRLIKQINDAIAREVNNDMRPRDITLSQMHVLIELDALDDRSNLFEPAADFASLARHCF